jgi:hypothetical protein
MYKDSLSLNYETDEAEGLIRDSRENSLSWFQTVI